MLINHNLNEIVSFETLRTGFNYLFS